MQTEGRKSQGRKLVVLCGRQETTNSVVEKRCRNENRDVSSAIEIRLARDF